MEEFVDAASIMTKSSSAPSNCYCRCSQQQLEMLRDLTNNFEIFRQQQTERMEVTVTTNFKKFHPLDAIYRFKMYVIKSIQRYNTHFFFFSDVYENRATNG